MLRVRGWVRVSVRGRVICRSGESVDALTIVTPEYMHSISWRAVRAEVPGHASDSWSLSRLLLLSSLLSPF